MTRFRKFYLVPPILTLCFTLCGSLVTQTTTPNTPAGQTLRSWLDAFNSGDREKVAAYVKTIDASQSVDGMISFRDQTNGFQLVSVESSEPLHIRFVIKESAGDRKGVGNLIVKAGNPPTVATFSLSLLPPNATIVNVVVDQALRQHVIDGVKSNLLEFYVDAQVAQRMVDAVDSHQKAGDYNSIIDPDVFATRLTEDLRSVSHDKHLAVTFHPFKSLPETAMTIEDIQRMKQDLQHDNCAFEKVEILPGNLGYIKFNAFMDPGTCAPTVVAAMAFIAHTDAVIFDLRDNGGGDPAMVSFVASYLFDQATHLNDLYTRKGNTTQQYWTATYVPGMILAKEPVYVLTSKHTFSGAEEFSYDLKTQKRATIVGETTGGGAHPVSGHSVADYFNVGVPWGSAVNPITHTSWEGTGVEPDVKVPAPDALTTAERLATKTGMSK